MAQSYSDPTARRRMRKGLCPECGGTPSAHDGWGGAGCSLTDNGVADRIAQYEVERADGYE